MVWCRCGTVGGICLAVHGKQGAAFETEWRRPSPHPSVSGRVPRVTFKTNGQEVQPEKQQYLQNIFLTRRSSPRLASLDAGRLLSLSYSLTHSFWLSLSPCAHNVSSFVWFVSTNSSGPPFNPDLWPCLDCCHPTTELWFALTWASISPSCEVSN